MVMAVVLCSFCKRIITIEQVWRNIWLNHPESGIGVTTAGFNPEPSLLQTYPVRPLVPGSGMSWSMSYLCINRHQLSPLDPLPKEQKRCELTCMVLPSLSPCHSLSESHVRDYVLERHEIFCRQSFSSRWRPMTLTRLFPHVRKSERFLRSGGWPWIGELIAYKFSSGVTMTDFLQKLSRLRDVITQTLLPTFQAS